jgi:spore germination protein GerM
MPRTCLIRLLAAAAAVVCAGALAACGDDSGGPSPTTTAPAAAVTAYFVDEAGRLVPERRELAAGADPLEAALAALAEGPVDPALVPALPAGTRVLGARVAGGVAEVDLSAEFESGYPPGGSAAELAVVAPLVRTAAEASGAQRVRILVEGRAPAPVGAQIDLSEPLSPGDVPTGG